MARRKTVKARAANHDGGLRWLSAADGRFTVRGLAWFAENQGRFCRLPLRAAGKVREPVWQLAQCPASARIAFRSNATSLSARFTNADTGFMDHMACTGSNGLFLYSGAPGRMRPWAVSRLDMSTVSCECTLFAGVEKKMREFRLYLPLYKGLESLELGLNRGTRVLPPSPLAVDKPVVFYGTSITQGGCASTAGSDFVSTLGRRLNLDVVNLGFSGNGQGEPELAELIGEIDASLYVLDYLANVDAPRLRRTLPRFVEILRRQRPQTPILLLTNLCYSQYDFSPGTRQALEDKRDITMEFYVRQRRRGDGNIHLADGFGLIPFGTDAAYVDGAHPADHGFQLMAERLAPFVEQILLRDS